MENVKKYKATIIITSLITLLPILLGLIIWNKLPDQIATHWGADGQADGYSGKAFAVFGMPCILAVLQLFVSFITLNDPKRRNIHKKPLTLVLWVIPVMSLITNGITYGVALGMEINVGIIVSILIGILFIILGNYMPKLQQNYTVGIRVPWTLNSTENWNRTHRLGGKMFILGGFLLIISGFLGSVMGDYGIFVALIVIVVICAGVPAAYSFWLFKRGV